MLPHFKECFTNICIVFNQPPTYYPSFCLRSLCTSLFVHILIIESYTTDEQLNPSIWNPPKTTKNNSTSELVAIIVNGEQDDIDITVDENRGNLRMRTQYNHSNMCPSIQHIILNPDRDPIISYSTGAIVSIFMNALWVESLVYRIVTCYI